MEAHFQDAVCLRLTCCAICTKEIDCNFPDDLKTLGAWGANLLRYQIVREWHARNNNQDRDEYLSWVDSKITHLLVDVPSADNPRKQALLNGFRTANH